MIDATLETVYVIARMALMVSQEDAQALVAEFDRIETLMPMLDPTGWQRISRTEDGHREFAEAFLVFRKKLEQLMVLA